VTASFTAIARVRHSPQTGDCALLLKLRRRSNLAPLALATCLGEERREHRLHRPRLAFRAGGAPLVLADRLLDAEALPALRAAVLVDRHKGREVIPARNGGQERSVYLLNGLRIGATVEPFTNASLPQYRAPSAAGVRSAADDDSGFLVARTIHNVEILVAEEFAPEGCDTVLTDLLCVLHRPICLFLHLAIGQEGIWGDEA